jgi:arginyl-tRNA--protein-N-Asp/Glu arginylyltransferase
LDDVKLLFSEATPDYARYLYPYVVWGFLEPGETVADAFAAGFLPASPALDRFYLVRHLRLPLPEWRPSSENRRILRKSGDIRARLVPMAEFEVTFVRRDAWLRFAAERFGPGVFPPERLTRLLAGGVITHVLHFEEDGPGGEPRELGSVLLHVIAPRLAYYYYAFYDLSERGRNLGMILMTRAAEWFAKAGFGHLYLGTCVTDKARYKLQFEPTEFFNGLGWSRDMLELRHLLDTPTEPRHRLDTPEFLAFQPCPLASLAERSPFRAST